MRLGWRGVVARIQLLAILVGLLGVLAWLTDPYFTVLAFSVVLTFSLTMVIIWYYIDVMIRWWDR